MLDITSFILDYYDNLSVVVLIFSIVFAVTICSYNYKSKLKEYVLNPRNVWYVAYLIVFAGVLFFLIERHYIERKWALWNLFFCVLYLVVVVRSLKPKINYFSNPILKHYAKKMYAGEIIENLGFFEKKNHWFIQEMDLKIEYRLLRAKYFSLVHNYEKAYQILNSLDEKYLYEEEIIFVNRKKAIQLTQMGAMSEALLLLGKPDECDSQDPFVWAAFSTIYEQQGNIDKAMEYISRAKDLINVSHLDNIDIVQIYNNYGKISSMNENKSDALYYYRRAYKLADDIKDMQVYSVLVPDLLIHMAAAGESKKRCEEILYKFKERIKNQSIDNLLKYNNCAISYYRQVRDEQAVFNVIKNGYYELRGKLSHEQAEIYKASIFRMIMSGRYIHDWFDNEIKTEFQNYEDLPLLSRFIIFREYMGVFSQLEFRVLLRNKKYSALYNMILRYYHNKALEDIDICLAETESVNIHLYKEIIMLKLGILRFIQKESHIELSKQEYLDLSNKLYDEGLRIEATRVLSVFIDNCTSEYNILVKMPEWPKAIFYYELIEYWGLPPKPKKLSDQIHLKYEIFNPPMELQIISTQNKYISEYIEKVIQEFDTWKAHPAKIEMSIFITHILVCLNRKNEAKRFYQYHKDSGVSELQFASWFRNQVSSFDDLFNELK